MTRAIALVAAAASVLVLAACAPEPQLPAPMTQAEAQEIVDQQNEQWWSSMFPGERMPSVDPIAYVGLDDSRLSKCLAQADLGGATHELANRTLFICSLEYPYDLSDPSSLGILTDAEYEWIWNYNQKRLVPCLQLLGFPVQNRTSQYTDGSEGLWSPYYDMAPTTLSDAEWARVDLRCPPSPVGPLFRPTGG